MTLSNHLSITHLVSGAGGHAAANDGLNYLDHVSMPSVINRTQTTTGTATEGFRYIAGTGVSGWTGTLDGVAAQTYVVGNYIAYIGGGWVGWTPEKGWAAYVEAEQIRVEYDTSWIFAGCARVTAGLTANLTVQSTALQLNFGVSQVTVSTGTNNAVKLPLAEAGGECMVINADAADAVLVFPGTSDAINALAADASYSLAAGKSAVFRAVDATTWYSVLGA